MNTDLKKRYSDFFEYLEIGKVEIGYCEKTREFTIRCTDGQSGIVLKYCPWSGKQFPPSLRDSYFDILEEMGLDAWEDEIPKEFQSGEWWKQRGL